MLNLTRLQLFHELSVLGTISAVAQALRLTRPAVSQQLAILERETGAILFERSAKGARLTSAGQQLLAQVRPLFELVNTIESGLLASRKHVLGEIRLAAFGSVSTTIVPSAVAALLKAHTSLDVFFQELEPYDGLKATAAKQVDISVVDDLTNTDSFLTSLDFHPLCVDQFVAVISTDHPITKVTARKIALADLAGELWALNQSAITYQAFLTQACKAAGFEPRVRWSCRNIAATLAAVRTGRFVTVLPSLAVQELAVDPDFWTIPIHPPLSRKILAAIPKGSSQRPAVAVTLEALKRAAKTYSAPTK